MTTKHHLFTEAEIWHPGEHPSSHSMGTVLGASDDALITIRLASSASRLELWHKDGRQLRIDLMPLYVQGEQLFADQPPAPDSASLEATASLIESLDMAARAHATLGLRHPDDHPAIRQDYDVARAVLWHHIASLIRQRDQMIALLELGAATMHDLVDNALDIADYLIADATELPDDMRAKLDTLRAMRPATAADVAPGSEQVQ